MILNINPTRMELLNLKSKLLMARRGHKLLKDKLDELVKVFLELVEGVKRQRQITDKTLKKAVESYLITKASSNPNELSEAYKIPWKTLEIKKELDHLMGIKVTKLSTELLAHPKFGETFQFNFLNISKEFENTLGLQTDFLNEVVKLAEIESKINLIGEEIEKTRRRVNALEYIMIPNYIETIRYISSKIDENERSTIVRLMKIKDIVRAN